MSDESNNTSRDREQDATKTEGSRYRPAEEDGDIQQVGEGSTEPENNETASKENKEGKKEKEKGQGITAKGVAVELMGGDDNTEEGKKKRRRQQRRLFSCFRRVTKCIRNQIEDDEDVGCDCCGGLFSNPINDDE